MSDNRFGVEIGEICKRNDCKGIIEAIDKGDCSCHLNPPCGSCTEIREYCPECGWRAKDDYYEYINQYKSRVDSKTQTYTNSKKRELDNSKIDWHYSSHTHFTMCKEGVYPEGTSREQVFDKVKGTFGGRFEQFGNGRFKFIAYTD